MEFVWIILGLGAIIGGIASVAFVIWQFHVHEKKTLAKITTLENIIAEKNTALSSHDAVKPALQSENFSEQIVSHINKGVLYIDQDRRIRHINPIAMDYIDTANPVGEPYQTIVRVTLDGKTEYAQIEGAFQGSEITLSEKTALVCQRGTFPIIGSIIPIKKDIRTIAVLFIFEDATAQLAKTAEEKAFFSAAAHELRTPLSVIRATISLLYESFDKLDPAKIKELLKDADVTTVQLINLVNDFLNISRIDQGRLDVKKEQFDIQKLTAEVVADQLPIARKKSLYLNHEIEDPSAHIVIGDTAKAREVIINLISNAIKYTHQGGITITHAAVNSHTATRVVDTGLGIAPDYQRLLFRRFSQIGAARTQSTAQSTGLGLFISKKMAQLMQGDVTLEKSEPGRGSTFMFTLPRVHQ